jgi:nucleotide-binding universal stress UspA family protein
MSWKVIVVGVDDTEASRRALDRAAEIAAEGRARLVLTSVAQILVGTAAGHGLGPFDPADTPEEHQAALVRAKDALAGRGLEAEIELGVGDPAHAIVSAAEKHAADLIVVGTREPGFLDRLLGGSVSQAVAREAHCDVLIVHPGGSRWA